MFDYYIDILKGVPKNHWSNAFIMQSDENLQKVLYTAEDYMRYSNDRADAMDFALKLHRLNETLDFTDLDQKRIRDWVKHSEVDFLKNF